jgi:2-polyprenyl-6-methoxyphenol hydroxylase-like FAD-dependent oxidoreductase
MHSTERRFGQAVVIGGSIAGLLTARVLSEHFAKVLILERDAAPESPASRKGIPQGRHVHLLLETGLKVMDTLFPGLKQELRSAGAALIDAARDTAWYHHGTWKPRYSSGIETVLCTRPHLEWVVRQRVAALPNVELRYDISVEEPLADAERTHITGVRLTGPGGEERLMADLVVDASGRGSRTPRWLEALGYGKPEVEEVGIDLAYTSRFYEPPAGEAFDWKLMIQYPRSPESWRSGVIMSVEGGRWIVSLTGYFGDHAPTDEQGFMDFVRSLPTRDIATALDGAVAMSPPVTHKIPKSQWLHYERLPRFPEGFVVLGDAACAFNPVFGQGMTVAGQGAQLLGACLAEQARRSPGDLRGLSRRFQKKLAPLIHLPWFLATTMDLHYPQTRGKRMPGLGVLHGILGTVLDMTSLNEQAYHQLFQVLHLRCGPEALLKPRLLGSLVAYAIKSLHVPLSQRGNVNGPPAAPPQPAAEALRRAS